MPRKSDYDDSFDDDELEFIEDHSEEELEELYSMIELDFPELDDYLEDLFDYDDEDFYTTK